MRKENFSEYKNEIEDYLATSSCLGIVLLDLNLNILDCNLGFMRLFGPHQNPAGEPLTNFLALKSGDLKCGEELILPCSQKTGKDGVINCLFWEKEIGYMLFCERLVLTESRVLEKMGFINDELINMQRELVKKNHLLEKQTRQLQAINRQLQESGELYQSVFNQAAVGIARVMPEGPFIEANDRLCNFLGLTNEELLTTTFKNITYPDDLQSDLFHIGLLMEGQIPYYSVDKRYIHKSGEIVWGHLTLALSTNEEENPKYLIAVVEDIQLRKLAEEGLRESEQFYRSLYEMLDGFAYCQMLYDGDNKPIDFKYLAVNSNFEKLTGLKDVVGRNVSEVIPGIRESDSTLLDIYGRVAETGTLERFEIFLDAMKIWFQVSVYSPKRGYFVAIFDVINERKRYEEELHSSSLRFKSIIDASPVPIALNNVMNITLLNPAFIRTFGYTLEDIPTLEDWWSLAYPDRAYRQQIVDTWATNLDKAKRNETDFEHIEVNILCKDGSTRTVIASAAAIDNNFVGEHLVILFDITDRIQVEKALRESKLFLDNVIDNSPVNMWISDDKGTLLRANQALLKQLTATEKELIGIYNIFDDPIVEEQGLMPHVRDVFDKGFTARFTITYDTSRISNLKLEKTSQSTLEVTISPVINSAGKVTNAIIQHLDISELKKLEAELRGAKIAAESASRAKSEFLANMSHEIRTPMNGLLGMTQLLEMTDLTYEQQDYIVTLKQSGKNLLTLLNDILDLSKIEAEMITLESSEFSLSQSIRDIITMQKQVAHEKGLSLKVELSQEVPNLLLGDQLRVKQILLNLLGNAIKFTAQGSITVSTQLLEHYGTSVLVQIAIQDSGIGISKEALEQIFVPFVQEDGSTTRKYGGTGLGLTISRRLAELMGGSITVESTHGSGSCFTVNILFAVAKGAGITQKVPVSATVTWDGPPLKVLLVEDDQLNIKFATSLFKKLGLTVNFVENGRECLNTLEHDTFDLVFMDIQMPVMNGEEALKEIRRKEQGTTLHQPVIALTAYSLRGDKERFLEHGFDGYLSKPLESGELISEIKRVVGMIGESVQSALEADHG